MRPNRPYSLGLVCWVLILGNMADLYKNMKDLGSPAFVLSLQGFPYPPLDAGVILFGTMVIFIITAILMYEGQGWARYIYVANIFLYVAHHYLSASHDKAHHFRMLVLEAKVVFLVLSIGVVFLPRVRRYFWPPTYIDE